MVSLYLVRHGQASFDTDNYDLLSRLGRQQSVRLGEYFKSRGLTFEAALTGTLTRQIQTLEGICEGMGVQFERPTGDHPQHANSTSPGTSAAHEATSVGACPSTSAGASGPASPGRRRSAPSGGSALRAATSVGVVRPSPARAAEPALPGRRRSAPSGAAHYTK